MIKSDNDSFGAHLHEQVCSQSHWWARVWSIFPKCTSSTTLPCTHDLINDLCVSIYIVLLCWRRWLCFVKAYYRFTIFFSITLLQRPQPWHLAAGPITAINNALGGLHRISSAIAIVANCSTSHRRLRNLVICRLILVVLLILFGCVVGMMREIIFFCDTKYNWMEHDVLWLPLHCHCHNCHLHLAFHCCRGCITLYR